MVKIIPTIWFASNAEDAAAFYISLFPNSQITRVDKYTAFGKELHGHDAGETMAVNFRLAGQDFIAINGGPIFRPNPSISFFVRCKTADAVRSLWARFLDGGTPRMDLSDEWGFNACFGWISDKFGVDWQIGVFDDAPQTIIPALLFTQDRCGRAEAAIDFLVGVFPNSAKHFTAHWPAGIDFESQGNLQQGQFALDGYVFTAMDSGRPHPFVFNEGVSFTIVVRSQDELDYFWGKLSAVPSAEACGWLKDQFGISWQVVPEAMDEMLENGTPEQLFEVTKVYMGMKRFDIAALQQAFDSKK
jgi:predicted 3-demethylubiquinone-9 3-methyltransferase (glyoxalase superfamily)